MSVKPIPEGFRTLTPYLVVTGVPRLIDFLKAAFGAREHYRSTRPDGVVMHASLEVGDSMLMMGEAQGTFPPMPACLYVYVPDVDATYRQAVAAGGISLAEPANQFYGDRKAGVRDPSGNMWWLATHVEDVTEEEIARRAGG
jgi:uncharacterized glyoxalase superfamily protein PhnB